MIKIIIKYYKGKNINVEKECWNDAVGEVDNIIYQEDLDNIKSITIKKMG